MDLPVPRSMDGQVLQAAIEDPVLAARPVRFEEDGEVTSAGATATGEVYSEEDSAEVEARLAGLGYLS
jgi:hypothetical protein